MIDYITIIPPDSSDSKRAFRYPFYACELLCCDNSLVYDFLFPKEESFDESEQKENSIDE